MSAEYRTVRCPDCGGSGEREPQVACPTCLGQGELAEHELARHRLVAARELERMRRRAAQSVA